MSPTEDLKPSADGFSWFAFGETMLVSFSTAVIVVQFELWQSFFFVCCFAPFLLLRNKYSIEMGNRWYLAFLQNRKHYFSRRSKWPDDLLHIPVFYLLLGICTICIKVAATILSLILYPREAVKSIRLNWRKQCFATTLNTPIEPVPGIGTFPILTYDKGTRTYTFLQLPIRPLHAFVYAILGVGVLVIGVYYQETFYRPEEEKGKLKYILAYALAAYIIVKVSNRLFKVASSFWNSPPETQSTILNCAALIAWWYRWSLKSSFLIWSLFILRSKKAFHSTLTADQRLIDMCRPLFSWIVLCYSVVNILFIAIKYIFSLLSR